MNKYVELSQKHEAEMNAFPFMFAYSLKQFEEGMAGLGLLPSETDKVYSIPGVSGCYIRKSDSPAMHEMLDRQTAEREAAIAADETGEGFILDMFVYELENHEYSVTWDLDPALDALGLTLFQINNDPRLLHGLRLALRRCR